MPGSQQSSSPGQVQGHRQQQGRVLCTLQGAPTTSTRSTSTSSNSPNGSRVTSNRSNSLNGSRVTSNRSGSSSHRTRHLQPPSTQR
jgi:hypothetical protein